MSHLRRQIAPPRFPGPPLAGSGYRPPVPPAGAPPRRGVPEPLLGPVHGAPPTGSTRPSQRPCPPPQPAPRGRGFSVPPPRRACAGSPALCGAPATLEVLPSLPPGSRAQGSLPGGLLVDRAGFPRPYGSRQARLLPGAAKRLFVPRPLLGFGLGAKSVLESDRFLKKQQQGGGRVKR